MRAAARRAQTLLVALAIGTIAPTCRAKSPAPTATAPRPADKEPDDALPIAADAGGYYRFYRPYIFSPSNTLKPLPEIEAVASGVEQFFRISAYEDNPGPGLDAGSLMLSWAIVEPAQLERLLASPEAPPENTSFAIRAWLVMPVADVARAEAALERMALGTGCMRPGSDDERSRIWIANLVEPDDQRAARTLDAKYVCSTSRSAVVARLNAARAELEWTSAYGTGALVAAAAAPVKQTTTLGARLRAEFRRSSAGYYSTPADEARTHLAYPLAGMLADLVGVPAGPERNAIWKRHLHALKATRDLLRSPPSLFAEVLVRDQSTTWGLSADGRTFFASLGLPTLTDSARLQRAVAAKLRPKGVYAARDRKALGAAVWPSFFVGHFLWPHELAISGPPTGKMPTGTDLVFRDRTEIDLYFDRAQLRSCLPGALN